MQYYIGVDFHKQFSSVCIMDCMGNIAEERKLMHGDKLFLLEYFVKYRGIATVSLEATRNWYWFVDMLQELGLEVKLVNAHKTRIIAESTIKTDKIDARVLAHLDRCNFLPIAYIAEKNMRHRRELLRYRISLTKIQTSIKNRVHAILAKHNIQYSFSDLFGKAGRKFLTELKMPAVFKMEIDGYLELLDDTIEKIDIANKEIQRLCEITDNAKLLISIPGISHFSALLLDSEIADIKRFKSIKGFICYGGFASSTRQSADNMFQGKIIKASNKYIRYVLIESIKHIIKKDPKMYGFYNKIKAKKGAKKARIATARKLLTAIYYMLKNNQPYEINNNNTNMLVQVNSSK